MKLAICDDEELELQLIARYCNEYAKNSNELCDIRCFKSSEEFLFKYEDSKDYDVIFLDIQMDKMSGMELAKKLRRLGEEEVIIFITGDKNYVFEGYEVQAFDYILKPLDKEKLFKTLDRVKKFVKEEDYIFIKNDGISYKVKQSDIVSIESDGHTTIFHMLEEDINCSSGIGIIEKELNKKYFYKCHRSYLINISKINTIAKKEVTMEDNNIIPIARGKWEMLNKAYLDYYRGVICR